MLFVKSTSDILQGVSKLDNLLKVSKMQNYKIHNDINTVDFDALSYGSSINSK